MAGAEVYWPVGLTGVYQGGFYVSMFCFFMPIQILYSIIVCTPVPAEDTLLHDNRVS